MKFHISPSLKSFFYVSLSSLGGLACTTATGALSIGCIAYTLAGSTAQADTLSMASGDTLTIENGDSQEYEKLTLTTGNTLTNEGELIVNGSISTSAASEDSPNIIANYGDLEFNLTSTSTMTAYNSIINYDDATITVTGSNFVFNTNASIINAGNGTISIDQFKLNTAGTLANNASGTVYLTSVTCFSTGGLITSGADATGKIIIGSLSFTYSTHQILNEGAGDIITTTATFTNSTSALNTGSGNLAFGSVTYNSSVAMENSGSGNLYLGSGSLASGRSIINSGSGTLYIGTSYSYTDPTTGESVSLATTDSFTLTAGSSISNGEDGTLSLDGTIVLGDSSLITNDGSLDLGENLVFDISSLTADDDGIYQIFSTDSTGDIDLSDLDITNLTGYSGNADDFTVEFTTTGGVTITLLVDLSYTGAGGAISLGRTGVLDGQDFESGKSISFANAEGATDTATTLLIDTGADTSIKSLIVGDDYNLTLGLDSAEDALSISTISIASTSTLTLTDAAISYATLTGAAGASLIFGGSEQNYTLSGTDLSGFAGSLTVTAGNSLDIAGSLSNSLVLESNTTLINSVTGTISGGLTVNTSDTDNGSLTLQVAGDTTTTLSSTTTLNGNTLIKDGEGTLVLNVAISDSDSSDLVINAGTVAINANNNKFTTVTINEGGTYEITSSSATWGNIVSDKIIMQGGTLKDTSGKTNSANPSYGITIQMNSGDNTFDMSESTISDFTFTNIVGSSYGEDTTDPSTSANLSILGNADMVTDENGAIDMVFSNIYNYNGTINSDEYIDLYIKNIDNKEGETTAFTGDVNSTKFTKTGNGNVSFENFDVTGNFSLTGTGSITVTGTITIGGLSITAAPTLTRSVSQVVISSLDGSTSSITYEDGTLTNLSISNAAIETEDDLTLNTVDLSMSTITAADVTLNNVTATDTSITADNLVINTGVDISADGLTVTVTALDGLSLSLTGDLTLNIEMTEDEQALYDAALASGEQVSIEITGLANALTETELSNSLTVNLGTENLDLSNMQVDDAGNVILAQDVIPEPSTTALSLMALAALLARRRRNS